LPNLRMRSGRLLDAWHKQWHGFDVKAATLCHFFAMVQERPFLRNNRPLRKVGGSEQDQTTLPATVLPRPQSYRADLEGPPRQRKAQPPLHRNGGEVRLYVSARNKRGRHTYARESVA
jgi:hypothetical protein